MNNMQFCLAEAWYECRAHFRGPLVPIIFIGLIAYLVMVLTNADYLREMGGANIPRNSPHLIYMMATGQAIWLFFAWAWIFGQVVVRDQGANLHELVLSAPVSLRALLIGRYLGAVMVACFVGMAMLFGFTLVPVMGWIEFIPPETVGPTPVFAIFWSLLVFIIPSAFGLGALFISAALKMRSIAGPFLMAAALTLTWMIAMVSIRGGDLDPAIATLFDPSAYAEAEEQSDNWTPVEKAQAVFALTWPFIINRLIWLGIPLLLLAFVLGRLTRETLAIERNRNRVLKDQALEKLTDSVLAERPQQIIKPRWLRVMWSEAWWHLTVSVRGWGFLMSFVLMMFMCVMGSFVNVIGHADGPFVPYPHLLMPLMIEFCYLIIVFVLAGFVGLMMRRDEVTGFNEMVDSMPAPIGVRICGRILAAFMLTIGLGLIPVVAAWVLMGIVVPSAFSFLDPLLFSAVGLIPALLEVCALIVLVHALIRNSGAAYAASMMVAFIIIVNHEISVIAYPPLQLGVPAHITLSEFAGWSPWIVPVLAMDGFKLGIICLAAALAWLLWPRGTDLHLQDRWHAFTQRIPTAGGGLVLASIMLLVVTGSLLYQKLVVDGEFANVSMQIRDDADWEMHWWHQAASFSVTGGSVKINIDPAGQQAEATWQINGVTSDSGALHAALPHGITLTEARVNDQTIQPEIEHDHFALPLGACATIGCKVLLTLSANMTDWPVHEEPPWLHHSGVWLRADNILPTLGHDPQRLIRSPLERQQYQLPEQPKMPDKKALVAVSNVAPQGDWHWSVTFADHTGAHTATTGQHNAPLNFAVVWLPTEPTQSEYEGIQVWHGATRGETAQDILRDLVDMRQCVEQTLGSAAPLETVIQAPRELGDIGVYENILWLPEHAGWDVKNEGFGKMRRRTSIARAIAAESLIRRADLRAEPGYLWLIDGVAGWVGLDCVRRHDGNDAWLALISRHSDQVTEALGNLTSPVTALTEAAISDWVENYIPLATLNWAESMGETQVASTITQIITGLRANQPLAATLVTATNTKTAQTLLGLPAAADVAVSSVVGQELAISTQRWHWQAGGWQAALEPVHVVQRFEQDIVSRRIIGPTPMNIEPGAHAFTLLDTMPSFERTPADNIWRDTGGD
ncbi:MAG: ABC transporter permease [Pseudomonadota bacterium]